MVRKKWRDSSEFSDDEDLEVFHTANEARSKLTTYKIRRLKHNLPDSKEVSFGREDFSEKAWEKLGGYVGQNDYIECMSLRQCNLNDDSLSIFLKGALDVKEKKEHKTKVLTLYNTNLGPGGMRSLVPFLHNNLHNLTSLNISANPIETEGFLWLMRGVDGGCLEKLNLRHCELASIALLEGCSLKSLQVLYLSDNQNIGLDGCTSVVELLRRKGTKLRKLYMNRCNLGDAGAEMLAESLVGNKVLTHLELESNSISTSGHLALLKLVNNITSVESTCSSNHLLRLISLSENEITLYNDYIEDAIKINRQHNGNLTSASRAKVIKYHLKSNTRMILSGLQGVGDYFHRPFVNLDSSIVPDAVALLGQQSGLSDMYRLLVSRNSDLGFGSENKALKDKIAELNAIIAEQNRQIATLTAKNLGLKTRLASVDFFAKKIQSNLEDKEQGESGHGKKRPLSDVGL